MAHDIQVTTVRKLRLPTHLQTSLIYLRYITKMETRNLKLTDLQDTDPQPDQISLLS